MLEIAKRIAHNLSKPISLELTIKRTIRHVPSHNQDQFYFERSKLAEKNTEMHEKIPVVCILGWAGSLNHHVRKYEKIYSQMGYHTIYFAPTNKTTFLQYRAHKTYTKRFINMVHELGLTNNPIITHMFSNAGCFIVYQHLLTDPEGEFFKRNHKSAIFDSALGLPHKPLKLISGINNLIRPNISSTPLRYLWATGMVAVYRIYHHVNLGNHYFTKMFEIVENDERSVPTLFLYSRQDSLICPDNMRRFVEKRQKGGFHIDPVLYDDCDHCSIYTKHPEDYLNRLRKHLEFSKMDLKTVLSN